jgi:REP element-mobilizing transposase RayT
LKGHDYAFPGAYFVTICVQDRACLLGEIVDGLTFPNAAGDIVEATWQGLRERYPTVDVDAFVVMPNHVHGIILVGAR